jgi:hypothetical protein
VEKPNSGRLKEAEMSVNFLQTGEYIDEKPLAAIGDETVYAIVGRSTGKLLGFKVVQDDPLSVYAGKIRHIYFHDIDHMEQIIAGMKGDLGPDGKVKKPNG